jgi:hypothetical protein
MTRTEQLRQWGIALLGLPAAWMMIEAGEWSRWGVLLGLVVQPLWIVSTLHSKQWGMHILSIAYLLVWLRGTWIYWSK